MKEWVCLLDIRQIKVSIIWAFFTLKKDHYLIKTLNFFTYFCISSHPTLKETFTATDDGVLPRSPKVNPNSEIKRHDEHAHSFHMRVPCPPVNPA